METESCDNLANVLLTTKRSPRQHRRLKGLVENMNETRKMSSKLRIEALCLLGKLNGFYGTPWHFPKLRKPTKILNAHLSNDQFSKQVSRWTRCARNKLFGNGMWVHMFDSQKHQSCVPCILVMGAHTHDAPWILPMPLGHSWRIMRPHNAAKTSRKLHKHISVMHQRHSKRWITVM